MANCIYNMNVEVNKYETKTLKEKYSQVALILYIFHYTETITYK